ncbi:Uncharacterized protein TCM_000783 [Theobroma cacao]|uniref:Uncharacterized protein n=1 Tax=Theobroma cacao TaxID=3641 RepID=A0A061DH42_THECC|nr:Uncharacterized protein TCM_000783 [Theobroma cacao]
MKRKRTRRGSEIGGRVWGQDNPLPSPLEASEEDNPYTLLYLFLSFTFHLLLRREFGEKIRDQPSIKPTKQK